MAVNYTKSAQRDMKRISRADADTIVAAIDELAISGRGDVVKLHGLSPPAWRLRVGNFRIVFRREAGTLWVLGVGDRKDVYRG